MIRAMLMWLAGATFEVRMIKTRSGKDIPGRLYCRGGYWKCRKYFKHRKVKYGLKLRLQAANVLDNRLGQPATMEEIHDAANKEMSDRLDKLPTKHKPFYEETKPVQADIKWPVEDEVLAVMGPPPEEGIMSQPELPADLGEPVYGEATNEQLAQVSIAAGSGLLPPAFDERLLESAKNMFEPDREEHECDVNGWMDWDFDADDYLPTCSICGKAQP